MPKGKSFAEILEEEWVEQSEALEEKHFDAAFEAKVAELDIDSTTSIPIDKYGLGSQQKPHLPEHLVFHGKSTTHIKSNCYSPYVPSNALRIHGMIDFVQFYPNDRFCDMGCGDGRVCFVVAAAQFLQQQQEREKGPNKSKRSCSSNFRAIGIDVSKDCIDLANQHLQTNRHVSHDVKHCIQFYQADLTIDPMELLRGTVQIC